MDGIDLKFLSMGLHGKLGGASVSVRPTSDVCFAPQSVGMGEHDLAAHANTPVSLG